jgi:deoxycytidine triphosphate deaminase
MSVLSDRTIWEMCNAVGMVRRVGGVLAVQPVSVDVHLDEVRAHDGSAMVGEDWGYVVPGEGAFLLGCTEEVFFMPENIVGLVLGKSGVGRAGLMVECAGLIDPGFEGSVTLELANLLPKEGLELRRGMAIAQVMFMWVDQPVERMYGAPGVGSHYQGQRGPTISHLLG